MKWINIWTNRLYSPFLMTLVTEATVIGLGDLFFSSISVGGNYWENGLSNYFYLNSEYSKTVDFLASRALEDPYFLYNIFEISFKKSVGLRLFSENYLRDEISMAADEELLNYFSEFCKKFYDMYKYATVAALMGYREDNLLYLKMNKILKDKVKDRPEKFVDCLVVLTNPPKRLKTNDRDLHILELAKSAMARGLKTKVDVVENFSSELVQVKDKFDFLSFDFCDTITWDLGHYAGLVFSNMNLDVDRKIKLNKEKEKISERDFNEICDNLSFNKNEREIFELVRNLGYYKWAREHEFQEACRNIKYTQDEIGKRCGLSTLEAKYLFVDELEEAFEKPKEMKFLAQERFRNFLAIVDKKKGRIFSVGTKAEDEYKKIKFVEENLDLKEIKGTPACSGKAQGEVRIVDVVSDLKKMKEGNILVSAATNPDLLSGMRKAVAIITDEGGITCHAAIVSRELNIPCVVGTKVTTKILKDGDVVEVDADNGVVKIIKSIK